MEILKLKEKFQIGIPGLKDMLKLQEFELTIKPGKLTCGDIINNLETLYSLDAISFKDGLLYELIHEREASFLIEKYGYGAKNNFYFLKKGLFVIDGDPNFDYFGLYQVRYWSDGQVVSSEGSNDNYLLELWQQGKSESDNLKYSILTIDP